jgi:hypothetical protein
MHPRPFIECHGIKLIVATFFQQIRMYVGIILDLAVAFRMSSENYFTVLSDYAYSRVMKSGTNS